MIAAECRQRSEWERAAMVAATAVNLFSKKPVSPDAFNPFAQRAPIKKSKPLDPRQSLDLLAAAMVK